MKNNILLVLIFLSGAVFGATLTGVYTKTHAPAPVACATRDVGADLLLAQLEEAALPADVAEPNPGPGTPHPADEVPSQLVRTDWPEELVMGAPAKEPGTEEKPAGIVLDDAQHMVVFNAQRPPHRAAEGTSITMIEAPVSAKRITSLDQYKAFKRVARGSYPTADFAKEDVLVLESQSNLPDKVFEIVEIIPGKDEIKVMYRVNMFGLDKKTNTHSAQTMPKTKLPVVLEQVL